jgi:hypothetical protein
MKTKQLLQRQYCLKMCSDVGQTLVKNLSLA